MMCPKCGKEMNKGYLFISQDGALKRYLHLPSSTKLV